MTQDEIIASNLSQVEKANERIKILEDKLAYIKQAVAELESQERNFCPRCGKRTKDLTTIHTCTPPQD